MRVLDLFSGIGGFSLGLERAGMTTAAFCEIDPFCQQVLKKHWPKVPIYDDVTTLTAQRLNADRIGRVDGIVGGFPCQDLSVAGTQTGLDGARSGLWSQFSRIIGEVEPMFVVVENVTALLSGDCGRWFGRILGDLAALGYTVEWHCIPASAVGAYHHRDRVWIIAYRDRAGGHLADADSKRELQQSHAKRKGGRRVSDQSKNVSDPDVLGLQRGGESGNGTAPQSGIITWREVARAHCDNRGGGGVWQVEPGVGRVADGVPGRMDRLKSLGNAVVPQVVEVIGLALRCKLETIQRGADHDVAL